METISCECGSKIPVPQNPSKSRMITTPCLKCKTHWAFHYDDQGLFSDFLQRGKQPVDEEERRDA